MGATKGETITVNLKVSEMSINSLAKLYESILKEIENRIRKLPRYGNYCGCDDESVNSVKLPEYASDSDCDYENCLHCGGYTTSRWV